MLWQVCGVSFLLFVCALCQSQFEDPPPPVSLHVLWPKSSPRPSRDDYTSWYDSRSLDWVSEGDLPQLAPDAKVDIFFLTKPVFAELGRFTDIWHAGIGLRVENGSSYMFEYTSIDFQAAIVFPEKPNKSDNATRDLLYWPSTAIVDYTIDPSGTSFPVVGSNWSSSILIGSTTGSGVNRFSAWAFDYAIQHRRYLVWRILENNTEQTLLESEQCFDFVFRAFRFLQGEGLASIRDVKLPRTVVNIYASKIGILAFNSTVAEFFSSERRVLEEWVKLSKELPVPFTGLYSSWYWPAWFSTTSYAGGTGYLFQDTNYPRIYHKYELVWPKSSKTSVTARGVHRVDMPILPNARQGKPVESLLI